MLPPSALRVPTTTSSESAAEEGEHGGEGGLVVLEVGVHDGDVVGGGGEHALDAGRRQAAAADAMEEADAGAFAGVGADDLGGAVGGVVVDEDGLPAEAGQDDVEAGDDFADVGALVVGGQDDGKVEARRSLGGGGLCDQDVTLFLRFEVVRTAI